MAVFEVIYRGPNGDELITLDSIEGREDFEEVKYDIYCTTTGCDCRMEYVPRGIKVAYFKKWRGNDYQHSLDCIHYTEIETGNRPRRRLGIHSSRLRSGHKKGLLKDMYNKYIETDEEKEQRKERDRNRRRNRPNIRVEQRKKPLEEIVNRPTTDNQGEALIEGERNPPVPRSYSILHINREQLKSTLAVIDRILEVENDFDNPNEKRSIITLTNGNNTLTFKIMLEPVFFAQAPLNIDRMLEGLKVRTVRGEAMFLSAVGEIVERNDEVCMVVFAEEDLNVNGKSIFAYLSNVG